MSDFPTKTVFCPGGIFTVPDLPSDDIVRVMSDGEIYDELVFNEIIKHAPPDTTIIDVGACYGQMSCLFALGRGPVCSIEASPYLCPILGANLAKNIDDYNQYFLLRGAAWSTEFAKLYYPEPDFTRFGSYGSFGISTTEGRPIDSFTLDALSHYIDSLSAIKIDAQGSDLHVLMGAKKLIATYRPFIVCEIEVQLIGDFGHTKEDYFRFFSDIDYDWRPLGDGVNIVLEPR